MRKPVPREERLELRIHPGLRTRLLTLAQQQQCSMGEVAVRLMCEALAITPEEGLPARRRTGRPPKV
jgi:predicted HicB family RNase H-like nuclease